MRRWVRCLVGAGMAVAAAQPSYAQTQAETPEAAPAKRAIVVLDSSATMLEPLETFKKYYLVRKDLQEVLGSPPAGVDVGLLAYGHRRRNACDDIEVLRPVEPLDIRVFFRGLMSVRPHGASPLAQALTTAGEALDAGESKGGKILLIAGAPDSCDGDPCAAAAELAVTDPKLTIDVVWLAEPGADLKQAQCVAKAGRGHLFNATTMADAEQMLNEAFAALGSTPVPVVPKPVVAKGAPGINVSARLGPQSEAYAGKVAWVVRKIEDGKPGPVVAQLEAVTANFPLKPGAYDVEGAIGEISRHQSADVKEGESADVALSLDAGTIQLKATQAKSGQTLDELYFTIYRLGSEADDPPETIAVLQMPQTPLLLSAGTYRVVAALRDIRVERTLNLAAGAGLVSEFPMSAGVLQIEPPTSAGAEPAAAEGVAYFISEDDPDQPLGQRDVGRSAMPNPSFDLRPGLYHVYARQGAAQARVDAVVKAGETTKISVPIVMGSLQLALVAGGEGEKIPSDLVSYSIERLDAAGTPLGVVGRFSASDPHVSLEAGRYKVSVHVGRVNVVSSADAVVRPGTETRVVLKPSLALLSLQFGESAIPVLDVLWELRDGDGQAIWSTTGANPVIPLAPGDYRVHAYHLGHDLTASVALTAGDRRVVVIRPE